MARRFSSTLTKRIGFTTIVATVVMGGAMAAQARPLAAVQVQSNLVPSRTDPAAKVLPVPLPPGPSPVAAICIGANATRLCAFGTAQGTGGPTPNTAILTPDAPLRDSLILEKQTIFSGGALENEVIGQRINLLPVP